MNNALKIMLVSALITAAAIKAAPALAEPASSPVAVTVVHTSDLDLTTAAGQRQLDRRLARAAREVCGEASDADLAGKNEVRSCRETVLADARAQGRQVLASPSFGTKLAASAAR